MRFRNFLGVARTAQQSYFKEGVELLYPDQHTSLRLAILPAYDTTKPSPTGWMPAIDEEAGEENDFYCALRAAKFVGHGNRRAKTTFLSPRTFDLNADDPYEAFYDYCSRSDEWSYLTKDNRGKRLTGEVEGAIIPRMKTFFVANVMDVTRPREGVFVTELSESVAKNILYSLKKNGARVDGLAFERGDDGKLLYGDITDPNNALVIEVAWGGKGYVARPAIDNKGNIMRVDIPVTLLQHRFHMEEPGSFIIQPEGGQAMVDRLAGMLRGYKSERGRDEINALKEAMKFAYGDKYTVDEDAAEKDDPFAEAARQVTEAEPEEKAEAVDAAVERGVKKEHYTPVENPKPRAKKKPTPITPENDKVAPMTAEPAVDEAPGEDIDVSDIAVVRAMLSGK